MRGWLKRGDIRLLMIILFLVVLALILAVRYGEPNLNLKPSNKFNPGYYQVIQVADGDTISVNMNGSTETIRMIGVDTPETHRPNTPVQCYGPEASQYTDKLLHNKLVRLESDPLNTNRDRYNRLLRYVYLEDGTLVESKLIFEGYGFAYTIFPTSKSNEFNDLQLSAQAAKRGLWSACQNTNTNGVWQTNPVGD